MTLLQLKNLTLRLNGKSIINKVNIDFWEGHIHAIVGPNGAGKSTLAAIIMGLSGYRDIEGDIIWKGQSIKNEPIDERARRGITLAWQEPARFEGVTIEQFIKASSNNKSAETVKEVLAHVGLEFEPYHDRSVDKTLSGGERKKIELASVLAMQPSFVMLDEPDSGIDIMSIQKIFEAAKILKNLGATVVFITHSLAVLEQAEHAFLMCCGTIIDKGNINTIKPYFENQCQICSQQNQP
jgi:Fe-S cluster assembly ATP-binding protein